MRAQPSWKYAGGDEQILDLPVESSVNNAKEGVDPKTGYPLVAQSSWKEAGGTGDILQLPVEDEKINVKVDPKTGYPLMAEDSWKDAGGNEDTIALPLEDTTNGSKNRNEGKVDPKTGYPLVAQPHWAEAGGNGDILELPLDKSEDKGKVDPKTGYPLEAEPGWAVAGGDETILDLPLEDVKTEGFPLTELRPPDVGSSYSTGYQDPFIDSPSPATFQNPGGAAKDFFDDSSRARESQQSQFMPISLRTNPAKNIFDFNGNFYFSNFHLFYNNWCL